MMAVIFFAFVTIFFWAIFEQAPSSLTIFARDYTQRVLEGNSAFTFKIVNSLMTIIPVRDNNLGCLVYYSKKHLKNMVFQILF